MISFQPILEQRTAGGMASRKKKECNSKFNLLFYWQSSSCRTQPLENNNYKFLIQKLSYFNTPEREQEKTGTIGESVLQSYKLYQLRSIIYDVSNARSPVHEVQGGLRRQKTKFQTGSAPEKWKENQKGSHQERTTKSIDSPLTVFVKWSFQKAQLKPIPEVWEKRKLQQLSTTGNTRVWV